MIRSYEETLETLIILNTLTYQHGPLVHEHKESLLARVEVGLDFTVIPRQQCADHRDDGAKHNEWYGGVDSVGAAAAGRRVRFKEEVIFAQST